MNDIMAAALSSGGSSGSNNQNNELPPMIFRSMSDASDIRRNQQTNIPYQRNNILPSSWVDQSNLMNIISPGGTGSRMLLNATNNGAIFASNNSQPQSNSCDQMVTNNNNHLNGYNRSPLMPSFNNAVANTSNTIPISNGVLSNTDEDDYDLNLVFDEIGALQNKGLNEPEDDNSTAPLQLPSPRSLSLTSTGSAQQQQQIISPSESTTSTNPQLSTTSKQQSTIEVDGKVYKYDPDLYDPTDITLSNEKYSLNAHYLRDFRCEQCPLFLQHKCTQHKPFTCFHWHFANQRRRRPLRKRDGTFNYSPDIYCTKYDDTSGICPDGDDCPYLHRTAGDTERRYHLRYYKTGMCVYETDARGYCMKNGAHCAFAHGSHDLRMAVFDVREQVQMSTDGGENVDGIISGSGGNGSNNNGGHMFDKDRNAIHEDPRWQNTAFVLAYYKTELCKRPPRLCRQGYACPQYHNNKDRRRSPKKFKYRSTPCPNVKQGDEWGDPANCENQDDCTYCHTRTEQQFHPEIYKSTKCNDVQQSGHCPRGPFCAFAHSESTDEINSAREFSMDPNAEITPLIVGPGNKNTINGSNTSPVEIVRNSNYNRSSSNNGGIIASSLPEHVEFANFDLSAPQPPHQMAQHELGNNSHHQNNNLGPIARPRSFSTSTTTKMISMTPLNNWLDKNNLLHKQTAGAGSTAAIKNHQNPHSQSNLFSASSSTSLFPSLHTQQESSATQQNPSAATVVPFSGTLSSPLYESVAQSNSVSATIDTMLNHHDLSFDELDSLVTKTNVVENHLSNLNSTTANNSTALNSFNTMLRHGSSLFTESEPINIPHRIGNDVRSTSAAGFNLSPPNQINAATASPIGSFITSRQSLPNGQSLFEQFNMNGGQPTPQANSLATTNQNYMSATIIEMQRLKEENNVAKNQLAELREKMQQVFQIYQMQLNEAIKKEKMAEKSRDEALNRLKELELLRTSDSNSFQRINDLSTMSRNQLIQLKQKLAQDMNCIDEALKIGSSTA